MIAILPIDIIRNAAAVEALFDAIGSRISTLFITSFSQLSKTGQAVMLDLHDVFMQSIQQEVYRARETLQARYPHMNIEVDRGLWNETTDFRSFPNKLCRIVLLLQDAEVAIPLDWLKERGLKGDSSIWLMSWRTPLDLFLQKKLLGYSLKEVKKNNPPYDFKKDELTLRQLLPHHKIQSSADAKPDFGLLYWKFNGALPSSLEKVLRDTLKNAPLVITHLLPDIRQ